MSGTRLLRLNPELQRCLWQELTVTRLVVVPSLLAVVLGGGHLAHVGDLAGWAVAAMVFLLVLWGSRLAADSYVDEIAQGTWDVQRLGVRSPWSMSVGKLAGGAVIAWYGAVCCLLVLPFLPGAVAWSSLVQVGLAGVAAQATALAAAIAAQRFRPGNRRGATSLAQGVGVAMAVPILLGGGWGFSWDGLGGGHSRWWGQVWPSSGFLLAQYGALALCAVVALFLAIRREFGQTVTPLPWLVFLVLVMADVVGFLVLPGLTPPAALICGAAALTGAACSYGAALAAPMVGDDVRRWRAARGWSARRAIGPAWIYGAVLSAALALVAALLADGADRLRVVVLLALFLRDLSLVVVIRLVGGRRASLLLCVAALVLYWLWPAALGGDGLARWAQAMEGWSAKSGPGLSLYWGQAAVALAAAILAVRAEWRRRA